jgi:hypothetical protein
MNNDLDTLLKRYRNRGIFVDANLLLLWFVGALDKQLIPSFDRTRKYAPEDFDTLDRFVACFKTRVTLPNVLTEVSNLAGQLGDRAQSFFTDVFSKLIHNLNEQYVPSVSVLDDRTFPKFGLTDCCIMSLVKNNYLLLTDDFRLSQFFSSVGGHAINFNHIRNWRHEG